MKLKYILPVATIICVLMSSCLKDTPFLDVSNSAPIIEFGQSPAQGLLGPFVYAGDTTAVADTAIALVLSSPQVENDTLQTIIALDPAQVSAYNTANDSSYLPLPDNLYTLSDTINILPGYRVGVITVKLKFPGLHRYGLPLKITGSYFLHSGTNVIISSNSGSFMWLFQ